MKNNITNTIQKTNKKTRKSSFNKKTNLNKIHRKNNRNETNSNTKLNKLHKKNKLNNTENSIRFNRIRKIKNNKLNNKTQNTRLKNPNINILKITIPLSLLTTAVISSSAHFLSKNTNSNEFYSLFDPSINTENKTPNFKNGTQNNLSLQNIYDTPNKSIYSQNTTSLTANTNDTALISTDQILADIAAIYPVDLTPNQTTLQTIISQLGANGYSAVDSENQINMTNPEQVYAFCQAVETQKEAKLTIIVITYNHYFHIYGFQTQNGNIEISHSSYEYQNGTIYHKDTVYYPADFWQYTEEGYLLFEGRCYSDIYYLLALSDMTEKNALRIAPLDQKCRELNQKYILPIGYESNNLFLTDWNENHYENLDFYDLFDHFYPLVFDQESPYIVDYNPNNETIYQIPKDEFETVIMTYIQIDSNKLQSLTNTKKDAPTVTKNTNFNIFDTKITSTKPKISTANFPANYQESFTYQYRPRGFYETEYSDIPYPEVLNYTKNTDQTITLVVNAVYPNENTAKAFSHKVVIRPFADGSFQYVSNEMLTPKEHYKTWWHSDRLTDAEWEELYIENASVTSKTQKQKQEQQQEQQEQQQEQQEQQQEQQEQQQEQQEQQQEQQEQQTSTLDIASNIDPIFENSCTDCVLSDSEKSALNEQALTAALQAKEVYQNIQINGDSRWESNIEDFTKQQCQQVVSLLGKAGYTSVSDDINMENYQKVLDFYAAYQAEKNAEVTIFNVNSDGYIGAFTFISREKKLQTYYVGIGWQYDGNPLIRTISMNDVAELKLTEKGYFIYTYAVTVAHGSARQYWRIKPLSDQCRALTQKYITGLSYVNYNLLVTNWDKNTIEKILMPCMFADIYRKDTGKNLQIENTGIPAPLFEDIMTTYFPVSTEQLRAACGYDEHTNTYLYEVIYAAPYPPFGEVVAYQEHADGTITLTVNGVWIDYHSDCAFTNQVVVQPFSDGSFRYLSNRITQKELEIPQITNN